MRILHLVDEFKPGGVAIVALDVGSGFSSTDDVAYGALRSGSWDALVEGQGSVVLRGWRLLYAILRADIVHSHHRLTSAICVLLGRQRRLVEHVHNEFSDHPHLSFRAASVVAVSERLAAGMRVRYPHTMGRVQVIANMVPAARFAARDVKRAVIAVGRLDRQKNPLYFLTLIAALRLHSPVTALWCGDGELRDQFLRERSRLGLDGVVEWRPSVDRAEAYSLMGESELLLLSSSWEGMPLVALEALACGTTIAITDTSELTEVIQVHDVGVILSGDESSDVLLIKDHLARLEEDPSGYSARARDLHASSYSTALVRDRWLPIYLTVRKRT